MSARIGIDMGGTKIEAVRLDPENAEAQARVAELRMAEGDTAGARHAAEAAVRTKPLVADSALELGVRVQLDDDVAVLRGGEGDRVRRFAVVLLLSPRRRARSRRAVVGGL